MIPSKVELENLHFQQKLSQKDIAKKFDISNASVCRWFKKYQIKTIDNHRDKEKLSKDNLIDLYINQGLTTEQIANKFNVHRVTIAKWLKCYNIPRFDVTEPKKIPDKEELKKLYCLEFKTLDEIGEIYKVNRNLVSKWLNQYNIKIRLFNRKVEIPTKEILDQLYNVEMLTISQISNIYKTNDTVVRRWFENFQIIARSNQRKYFHLKAIPFNNKQKEFIIGTMLGDGHLSCNGTAPRLNIIHSIKQMDYFFWKKEIMGNFINNCQIYKEKTRNSTRISSTSIVHNEFSFYYKLFYDNKKKIIKDELINYITPMAMAVWVMDDGWKNYSNIRISSESFTKIENEKLQYMIKINFNIYCKVAEYNRNNKKYYYLSFNKENSILLTKLIEPYFEESMKYKLVYSSLLNDYMQSSKNG